MNKSFCKLPFCHITIRPNGYVKPCCRFNTEIINVPNIRYNNTEEIFHGEFFNYVRTEMINGNKINDGCFKCYNEELGSIKSMRVFSLIDMKKVHIKKPLSIKFLEISFSNICNLKCRICSSYLSSAWIQDEIKLNKSFNREYVSEMRKLPNLNNISSSTLKDLLFLKFAGGEVLIDPYLVIFLKKIPYEKRKNITIYLYTNCSHFPNNEIIELLKDFKSIEVKLSIDAFGKRNEYIRKNSLWEITEKSALKWINIKYSNFKIYLATTVSAYNLLYLDELIKWWISITNKDEIQFFQILHIPEYLSPLVLSSDDIYKAIKKLKECDVDRNIIRIDRLIKYLENSKLKNDKYDEFLKYTKELDLIRNENYKEFKSL